MNPHHRHKTRSKLFWSDLDSRTMYDTDSEMTHMIEGKLIIDSEQVTKYSLEHGHGMT